MDILTLPENGARVALDETVRVLFQLQAQALKASQAQVDASQVHIGALQARIDALEQQADAGWRGSQDAGDARATVVAAITQLEAKTKRGEEQDEPAATYDRVRNVVIIIVVIVCFLLGIAPFTGGLDGRALQVYRLFVPLSGPGLFVLFFGTLDSSAMAATAARMCRALFILQGALLAVVYAVEGDYVWASANLVVNWFGVAYYMAWLLSTMRERMRTSFSGKLAERAQLYTARLLQIASVQIGLLVQGLAQGIGPKSTGRNYAIATFANALALAWALSLGVFDASETDPQRAARLRLSIRESAALVMSMLYVFTGLAGYIMAEQGDPDTAAAALVQTISIVCVFVAAVLVGRLVNDAKKKNQGAHHAALCV